LQRKGQDEYNALKAQWSERLLTLLHRHFPNTKGRVEFCDLSTPLTLEHYLRAVGGAGVGLDVTPQRFVDAKELAELDARHPRVPGLWRAGQDYLMCGQVMAAVRDHRFWC
jgi:phytoene dehydrogenase-like protein